MDNNDNNEINSENVNEGYLKEMETNNFLFNEKIKKLNNLLVNTNNICENKITNKKINKQNFDNHQKKISDLKDSDSENDLDNKENKYLAEEIIKNIYNEKASEIDLNKNQNLFKNKDLNSGFKRDSYNDKKYKNKSFDINQNQQKIDNEFKKDQNNDNILNNKISAYEKEIKQLKNENEYNRYVIDDLKNQLTNKNKDEDNIDSNMINKDDYNNLLKEIENKDNFMDKMKEDIKNLKFKIDNLLIENKKLNKENDSLKSEKEELKAELSVNKTENNNNIERINKLELMNKKLNKDYLNLSNDFKKVIEEKEKLKSIIDEQNAAIFNYEKQLSSKPKIQNLGKNIEWENRTKIGTKFEKKYELNNYDDENYKYEYSGEKINKYKDYSYNEKYDNNNDEDNKYYSKYNKTNENEYEYKLPINNTTRIKKEIYPDERKNEKFKYDYNNNNLDNENRPFKYNMKKSNSKSFEIINEKNKKLKKGELNYLENYLNSMLKERSKLEKMYNEIPEHPRTLKDIKLRNTIKDKIEHNENEIMLTQQKLKNLRDN